MKVDLFEFCRQGRELSGQIPAASLTRLELADQEGELRWNVRCGRDGAGADLLELKLSGRVTLCCQRCLSPMAHDIDFQARFRVMRTDADADAAPMDDDDFDPVVGSTDFDIVELVEGEALLAMPVVPRHASCPDGADALTNAQTNKLSPFAALAGYKPAAKKDRSE